MTAKSQGDIFDWLSDRGFDRPEIDLIRQGMDICGYRKSSSGPQGEVEELDHLEDILASQIEKCQGTITARGIARSIIKAGWRKEL